MNLLLAEMYAIIITCCCCYMGPKGSKMRLGTLKYVRHLDHRPLPLRNLSSPPLRSIKPEKLYIREYTSGNLCKNWSQGYCVQTALKTSFALLGSRQIGVNFVFVLTPKSAAKSSRRRFVSLLLHFLREKG